MANGRQSSVKRLKMAERAQQQMALHFPGVPPAYFWHRKTNDGYTTLPRTLPIAMQAIDDQSKGNPAGHTLFSLWARAPDYPFLTIENPATYAAEAGFTGTRVVDTWRKRMKALKKLWFIQTKEGPTGEFHYVFLVNPNVAVEWMRMNGQIQDGLYARFIDRVMEIGAFGEIEGFREHLELVKQHQAAAAAAEAAKTAEAANTAAAAEAPTEPSAPTVPEPSL